MDEPLNIHRHITLSVKKPLEKKQIKSWFDCVIENAPSGVVATIQTTDDKGSPRAVKLVHRTMKGNEEYIIPLSRDLLPNEVDKIVESFSAKHPEIDFDIETNSNFTIALNRPNFSIDFDKHIALASMLAKHKHNSWMKDKTDAGWRYGLKISFKNKTHPLLLPWEQLPDTYKKPDLEAPKNLVSMLNDQGYSVIDTDTFEKIMSLLKTAM